MTADARRAGQKSTALASRGVSSLLLLARRTLSNSYHCELSSLTHSDLIAAKGHKYGQGEHKGRRQGGSVKLKYTVPDVEEHDVGENFSVAALDMARESLRTAEGYCGVNEKESTTSFWEA